MNGETPSELIVVVDDDYAMRLSCRKILAKSGFRVADFEDGSEALDAISGLKPALVLVDLKMPGIGGMEVIARLHEIDPQIISVVITGYATIDTAVEAMKSGAYDFLPKPFSPEELRIIVNRGLERRRLALLAHRHEIERALLTRRFVTFVSHQLQTPLVAVHQYLDVLKHLDDSAEVAGKREEWLDRCLRRTEQMQKLIKDWLTLSRMESSSYARRHERVDVGGLVADIVQAYDAMAAMEGIRLEWRLPAGPCLVVGDPNCVSVVLDNLIGNAIKYNRPGGAVSVTAGEANGEIEISVADTGIGIPEESLPFLFEEFYRVKQDAAQQKAGTGLGLAICKRIVSEMGGTIAVQSRPGIGSTFKVRLAAWREQPLSEACVVNGLTQEDPDRG